MKVFKWEKVKVVEFFEGTDGDINIDTDTGRYEEIYARNWLSCFVANL